MGRKEEDESLQKYKESLLAGSEIGGDDPRHVVIVDMRIKVPGRDDIVMPLDTDTEKKASSDVKYVFKEGETHTVQITFKVQHDIVMGLKFFNVTYKMGLKGT